MTVSIGQLCTGCVIGCFNSFVNTFFCTNRLVNSYHKAKNTVHREDENSVLMFSFFLLLFMLSVDTFVFFPSMLRCFLVCCLSSLLSSGEKCSRPEYFKRKETWKKTNNSEIVQNLPKCIPWGWNVRYYETFSVTHNMYFLQKIYVPSPAFVYGWVFSAKYCTYRSKQRCRVN